MEKLRDENVNFEHVRDVLFLDVTQNVDEPLEVFVRRANPKEVNLLAGNARVTVGAGTKDEIVEDRSVGRDADATADHHSHFELVPILIATPIRALDANARLIVGIIIARVEVVAQLPSPRALSFDVAAEEVLVRC